MTLFISHGLGRIEQALTFLVYQGVARNKKIFSSIVYNHLRDGAYEVIIHLAPSFCNRGKKDQLYGSGHAVGTDHTLQLAFIKALNESVERLAFYYFMSKNSIKYGFGVDSSTSGMAAYSFLDKRKARLFARFEAVERWALVSWWNEALPTKILFENTHTSAREICTPFPNEHVVLISQKSTELKGYIYGFACSDSIDKALSKAEVELRRNHIVLKCFDRSKIPEKIEEKRFLFFSSDIGYKIFENKVSKSDEQKTIPEIPKVIVDCEVRGFWSRYVTVWRVLFEMPFCNYLTDDHFFLF